MASLLRRQRRLGVPIEWRSQLRQRRERCGSFRLSQLYWVCENFEGNVQSTRMDSIYYCVTLHFCPRKNQIRCWEFDPSPRWMAHHHLRVRSLITELKCSFASGAWSNTASHQSNLMPSQYGQYSTSGAIEAFISRGVPASKIYMGIPLHSRGFTGTNGLGSPATGSSPDTSFEPGVVDYKALPIAGATEMWDDQAKAGYSYDATRKVMNTYDVPQAVKAKCDYINQMGLGGTIIWESLRLWYVVDGRFGGCTIFIRSIYY